MLCYLLINSLHVTASWGPYHFLTYCKIWFHWILNHFGNTRKKPLYSFLSQLKQPVLPLTYWQGAAWVPTHSNLIFSPTIPKQTITWNLKALETLIQVPIRRVLCIWTSKLVLRTPFTGRNQFFDAKTTFSFTNGTK